MLVGSSDPSLPRSDAAVSHVRKSTVVPVNGTSGKLKNHLVPPRDSRLKGGNEPKNMLLYS